MQTLKLPFKPRARLILLLGDQLIREPGIAVFELVKNAYDADSPYARVSMHGIDSPKHGVIIVEDSGIGMDYNTVTQVWLEPGTDYRLRQKESGTRTVQFGRLPMGEKGVGRFAAHKLGEVVTLITRAKDQPEVVVKVDWADFQRQKYLSDITLKVVERKPEVFTGKKTGTRLEISGLRNIWTRGMVRELARSINSICSPFSQSGDFRTELELKEHTEWLDGLLTVGDVLERALFRAHCRLEGKHISYAYQFTPYAALEKVAAREVRREGIPIIPHKRQFINLEDHKIGAIDVELYIYDRDPAILALGTTDRAGLKEFLNESGGIRVYRDDIRVYDYGEPGNDWLNLGGDRVNIPSKRISNNLVVGAVKIRSDESPRLVEKTNREGFVDNAAFRAFRDAVGLAVDLVEVERNIDKARIRTAYSGKLSRQPVLQDLTALRTIIEKRKLGSELGSYLDRIEADYTLIRDRYLTSANIGLSLATVIHEVEKGLAELGLAVEREQVSPRVRRLAKHLADLVQGFAALIRRSGSSREKASHLIEQALFNTEMRRKVHAIDVIHERKPYDFEVECSQRLMIATIMNLIDNSIWWLDNKWGDSAGNKRIYVGASKELGLGNAIIVGDNGPGFSDPPEILTEAFVSRKPDGMGLGLHIADQVMKAQGGQLVFPEAGDLSLPREINGAIVALVFGGHKK